MFKSARIKLTAWYLLIIMVISLSFSAFIYRAVTSEFQRRLAVIENRLDLRRHGLLPPPGATRFFLEDLEEAQKRVLLILIYTNGLIFVFSAGAGYLLAGKTLRPIEETVEKQKRFVADAAHELRTPLTALKTGVEVTLRSKKLSLKQAKQALQEGLEEIDSMKKLVNNLLSLARYQTGNNFSFGKLELAGIAASAYRQIAPLAKEKQIEIRKEFAQLKVAGVKEELEKLITILLDNAVKYTPKKGKIAFSVKKEGKYACIDVQDSGIGIPKQDLPYIFERFYRVDPSRSKLQAEGTGLGLSMAKGIVELHKGTIAVKSSPDKGSTFTVKLPLSSK